MSYVAIVRGTYCTNCEVYMYTLSAHIQQTPNKMKEKKVSCTYLPISLLRLILHVGKW